MPRRFAERLKYRLRPDRSPPVRTGNKGNKRTEDIGNSFHGGGSDWAEKVLEGDTQSPTRSRSFVISEM